MAQSFTTGIPISTDVNLDPGSNSLVSSQLAVKTYVDAQISTSEPTGTIISFGGSSAPAGYLNCDGAAVSRATYASLFAVISTLWGVGDGSTTFNLPDTQRHALVGSGGAATATLSNSVGSIGGSETHTQTTAEMPSHAHVLGNALQSGGNGIQGGPGYTLINGTTTSVGSGTAFNIMQPSAVVLMCIKT